MEKDKTKFEVEVKLHIEIYADDLQEANLIMEKTFSEYETVEFYNTKTSETHPVIGHCEYSGLSIFEGDDFECDSDGVMFLKTEINNLKF